MSVDVQFLSQMPMRGYGTTEMRCVQPSDYLRSMGWTVKADCIHRSLPEARRALVLHRVADSPLARSVVQRARLDGVPVIYDVDDLLFDDDAEAHLGSLGGAWGDGRERVKRYQRLLADADLVTVSTEYLRFRALRHNPKCMVVRNCLSQGFVETAKAWGGATGSQDDRLRIAYLSGSAHHDDDLAVAASSIARLLQTRQDVELVLAGKISIPSDLVPFQDRISRIPFQTYSRFIDVFKSIDINLVPLRLDLPFANARSELKFIEAGAFAVPTIASPTETYAQTIENGVTGLLAADEDWFDLLLSLVDDPERRREMGRAAQARVLSSYGPEAGAQTWSRAIDTTQMAASQGGVGERLKLDASIRARLAVRGVKRVLKRRRA